MTRRYLLFIKDMLDAVDRIHAFVEGMDFEDFAADDKTVSAVLRKLEIIGEAAKNIPTEVRERHGAVPWSRLVKMRDRLTHGYFTVDNEIVWKWSRRSCRGSGGSWKGFTEARAGKVEQSLGRARPRERVLVPTQA